MRIFVLELRFLDAADFLTMANVDVRPNNPYREVEMYLQKAEVCIECCC